jgi:two-component system phosphate regulon sensor histidine kinase PhoR
MQEGVLLLNRERRVAHVNPALRNLLALSADVVGRLPIEIIRNASLTELLNEAFESMTPLSREIELSGPAPARVLVRIAPLGGPRGGLLAVFVDVTNLRHLETVRQQFVANASHELRTPIASIHSAAETLAGGVANDPATRERFLGIIARNATRLKNLVDDLLDLSKLESRTFNVPLRPTLVAAVVRSTFNALGEAAEKKQIKLVQRVDPALEVQADPQALEHVLTNLVENAIRYCPSGSEVTVSTELSGSSVRLAVADNGPGISEEHLSRLFERFYRVDAGRSRELGGTGLGLAIVKHWVEVMKGEVVVTSKLGQGSTFTVSLGVAAQ